MLSQNDLTKALAEICGEKHVITPDAPAEMAPFLQDQRGDYIGKAAAIARPHTVSEVAALISFANRHRIPVVPQGGNTSLCGGATPDESGTAILISLSRMNKIRALDPKSQTMVVEAGCILENIQQAAETDGYLFPVDFGARGTCQIGGILSTNAGGLNVVGYGNVRQLCLGLEAVTPTGDIMNLLSPLKKDNTGYDLKNLMIGAEGTLGIITAATMQLLPKPLASATAWAGVRDIDAAIELLARTESATGGNVVAFELIPKLIIATVCHYYPHIPSPLKELPEFSCLIEIASTRRGDAPLAEDGGAPLDQIMAIILEEAMTDGLVLDATIALNENQRQMLWAIRELIPESETKAGAGYKSDISVPLNHMSDFYHRAAEEARAIVPDVKIFGFGHLGDGNLHYNLLIPDDGIEDFEAYYPQFDTLLQKLLEEYHGSISAEHGIGQKKRAMLKAVKNPIALEMMRAIKRALDPNGIMNPGKIIDND